MIQLFQLNFGFCKGDDNFGGRKRKELDDFLKSLGKQMNLVMYRWVLLSSIRMFCSLLFMILFDFLVTAFSFVADN